MFLALDAEEVELFRETLPNFLPPEKYGLITEILPDGSDGATQLSLDVAADTENEAIAEAEDLYARARQGAGLGQSPATVLGYNRPTEVGLRLHDQLLGKAGFRRTEGRLEEAVVFAQAACEVIAAQTLEQLLVARDLQELQGLYKGRPVGLRDGATQPLFNMLASTRIQDEEWWPRYVAHAVRRNDVVHRGLSVNEAGAEASVEVAREFCSFVASFASISS